MSDISNKASICSIVHLEIIDFSKKTDAEQAEIKNKCDGAGRGKREQRENEFSLHGFLDVNRRTPMRANAALSARCNAVRRQRTRGGRCSLSTTYGDRAGRTKSAAIHPGRKPDGCGATAIIAVQANWQNEQL